LPGKAWSPLRHRDFAVLWSAALVSNIGSWMHDTSAGWLMTTLTTSPAMVAMVQVATSLPVFLLALPAGTLADRVDKRRLQIIMQSAALLLALTLGGLVLAGAVTASILLAVTFALGLCTAMLSPAWQAILPQLVPRSELQSAVALNAVGMNISRAIGPAIGGLLIASVGMAWPFLFNAASFIAVIAALWWWRMAPPPEDAPGRAAQSYGAALLQGLQLPRGNKPLQNTLWRSVVFYVFASAYWALLPLIARVHGAAFAGGMGLVAACDLGELTAVRVEALADDPLVALGHPEPDLARQGHAPSFVGHQSGKTRWLRFENVRARCFVQRQRDPHFG
jgi:MFS family permease